jgi:hypothetical protein
MTRRLTARLIKWQRGPSPRYLNHLVTCYDNPPGEPEYHLVLGDTLCGAFYVRPGQGGWGYGPKDCPRCFALGEPAERLKW